jgi:hypothetical protein
VRGNLQPGLPAGALVGLTSAVFRHLEVLGTQGPWSFPWCAFNPTCQKTWRSAVQL